MTKSEKLKQHLEQEHKQSPLAEYLKEIVYGGNDGIVTTFAVVAGFTGASLQGDQVLSLSFLTVLLFGLANLLADGLSMGLGNFLSIRAEKDVYKAGALKERHEIQTNRDMEIEETMDILVTKGFSSDDAKALVGIYQKNEDYWVEWMMTHELELPNPDGSNPFFTGFATFISFVTFGGVPLLPFALMAGSSTEVVFATSCISTLMALVSLGLVKWKVIGGGLVRSVGEIVLIGGTAAVVAFLVGLFF